MLPSRVEHRLVLPACVAALVGGKALWRSPGLGRGLTLEPFFNMGQMSLQSSS